MRIRGIALAAGVSLNRRLYTPEMIKAAVAAAQPDVARGTFLMRSGHDTPDVAGIAGRVTKLAMSPDGQSATFEAELVDTAVGRDAQLLAKGPRPLVGVSITGAWLGAVRQVAGPDGRPAEQGDGLQLLGLDLTGNPGVPAARIAAEHRVPTHRVITESAPAAVVPAAEVDLTALSSGDLSRYAAAAFTAAGADEPRPPAADADPAAQLAAQVLAGHARRAHAVRQRLLRGPGS